MLSILPLLMFLVWLIRKICAKMKPRDKREFSDAIASASEPKFEPRQGRKIIARGGTATCLGGAAQQRRREPWNPGYRKKRKLSPVRRSDSDAA